jgi:hypothetical protein
MGKPRRPRGSRSTWEPRPPQDADAPAPAATRAEDGPAAEAAPPAADTPAPTVDPVAAAAPVAEAVAETVAEPVTEPASNAVPEAAMTAAEPIRDARPAVAAGAFGLAGGTSAPGRIVFSPDRLDVVEIGSTIARYVRGEGEAALAHLRALSGARTPADLIRLQVGEVQRAADASLTCWVTVVGKASRVVAFR